ncbi:MAG: L-aspartate oxidase [bacterium]
MAKYEYDFLIIGSGAAGLYAAWYAANFGSVALLTKSTVEISNSFWAQGGIAAAVYAPEDIDSHIADTLKTGRGLCNTKAVEILVKEGKLRVEELLENGMPFDETNGQLSLGMEGGHSRRRILHAGGSATGKELVTFLAGQVEKKNNIDLFEYCIVNELIVSEGICRGVFAYDFEREENLVFQSCRVMLATGGCAGIYERSTNPHTTTGDGISLAFNAGCDVADMEFMQFHPTAFYKKDGETFLISEAVRGEGAYLVNHKGKRFMLDIDPAAELAPRDIVSKAIFNEMHASGKPNVFLKLDHLNPEKIKKRFANIYEQAMESGIDITKDPIPVAPAAHYMVGGIKSGLNGETNIKGLYSFGEAALTGVNGANRLASNSLLECIVFAKRAIDFSLKEIITESKEDFPEPDFVIDYSKEEMFLKIKNDIAEIMMDMVGILRTEESLKKAISQIENIPDFSISVENEYYNMRLQNLKQICLLMTRAALLRTESRGVHLREDFPHEENSWIKRIVFNKKENQFFTSIE